MIIQNETSRLVTSTPLDQYKIKPFKWLIKDCLPLGQVTLLAGAGGQGKSTICTWVMARVTQGLFEGEYHGKPMGVGLIEFGEDPIAEIVAPRLKANGADLKRVHHIMVKQLDPRYPTPIETAIRISKDRPQIIEQIKQNNIALLVVDPITRIQDGDNLNAQDVQYFMHELGHIAKETGISIVGITHFAKGGGKSREKIAGSHQWVDGARCVWVIAEDKETGQKILSLTKINAGKNDQPSHAFSFTTTQTQEGNKVPRVEYLGPTDTSVEQIINREPEKDKQYSRAEVAELILEQLRGGVSKPSEVKQILKKEYDISARTVDRAKKQLEESGRLLARMDGIQRRWYLPTAPVANHTENETFSLVKNDSPTKTRRRNVGNPYPTSTNTPLETTICHDKREANAPTNTCPIHHTPLDINQACQTCLETKEVSPCV